MLWLEYKTAQMAFCLYAILWYNNAALQQNMYDYFQERERPNEKPEAISRFRKRYRPWYKKWWGVVVIIVFTVCVSITVAFVFFVFNIGGDLSQQAPVEANTINEVSKSDFTAVFDTEDRYFKGSEKAQVVLVEFIDYECSDCRQADVVLEQLLSDKNFQNQLKVVYYHFPIVEMHSNALKASMAVECAGEQGKFLEMHNKLLENQENLSIQFLKLYAVQIDLDSVKFSQCLDSNKYLDKITGDFEAGATKGVSVAPTFFLREEQFSGVPDFLSFQQILSTIIN